MYCLLLVINNKNSDSQEIGTSRKTHELQIFSFT